ncbi:MAG TPA: hypothetical protein VGD67_24590, partial [Pseudonocardiaceae bacterium]
LPWRDVLHLGPVPALPPDALRRERAAFLASCGWTTEAAAASDLGTRDATLARHRGELVLWFEADLYDQLQLVQVLAALAADGADPARITLVCVGEYPGIGHFGGLGELTPEQLLGLRPGGATLTAAALDLAASAWAALTAPTPEGWASVAATVSGELRFVPEAFDRLGRELPSTRDGLSLTERRVLAASAGGPLPAAAVFRQVSARETRPFLGDSGCFRLITGLVADGLLAAATPVGPDTEVAPTGDGRRVLGGSADRVDLAGFDRWVGGTHVVAPDAMWRWDEGTERVTRWPAP